MTHLPMARASMDVVATTSLVLQFTNTCGMHIRNCFHVDFGVTLTILLPMASAPMEVVAPTLRVLQFTKTCCMHTRSCPHVDTCDMQTTVSSLGRPFMNMVAIFRV